MSKTRIFSVTALLLLVVLVSAQATLAGGATPAGGPAVPRAVDRSKLGPRLTAADLDGITTAQPCCMVDSFGYPWNAIITRQPPLGPGYYTIAGTVNVGAPVLWNVSGWIQKYKNPVNFVQYWRADNFQADGCLSGWTDYWELSGSGAKFTPAGTWTSYCSGSPVGSGSWSGTIYKYACPGP
jgi:hypothetical protein